MAALPLWTFFDRTEQVVVSRHVLDQSPARRAFLICLAKEYQGAGVCYLSCWPSKDVVSIVRAVARSLGNSAMGAESSEETNLRNAFMISFKSEPPDALFVASLSHAVEHVSMIEDILDEVHQRIWRTAILISGQMEIGLQLLKLWSETASENLQKQFRAVLFHMGQWILSGELALLQTTEDRLT